ncbi:MAG: hypothetical protein KC478_15275 [Bacteriovoracaceae bacterium]|nr:hypothetical protein [Bacteriovoracaceae bacterium]
MDTNKAIVKPVDESQLDSIIESLGIPEISADVLKTATLGNFVLDELKTAIDETEKPIH